MLNKWGYEIVDMIIWAKLKDQNIYLSHGYYFMHSFEICLVGYKSNDGTSHSQFY
jgi:N6-adenosine-specific RNA methylase IME4